MAVCHMICLHGDTNGISLNERPAAWPLLVPHSPVCSLPSLLLLYLQLVSDTFSLFYRCIHLFNLVHCLDRLFLQ